MKRYALAGAIALVVALPYAATQLRAQTEAAKPPAAGLAVATFAGGCFWCMEPPYDKTDGVVSTTSGYIGGRTPNPSYEQIGSGGTGHTEGVQVVYDPKKVSYGKLLDVYWRNVDPFDGRGQFCDKGSQYRPEIFAHNEEQKKLAAASKAAVEQRLKRPVAVKVTSASTFYVAEDYHQDYYRKNPVRYKFYRYNCGRDARLEVVWGPAPTN
ncbi:MAG: peptide-methionine (S)-S-oxide reductase MsrA [Rhizobiales bacterium]|nr:peptide-methionine (S)-S-oxide reductase MsrA [Hyphomicrobiales bacterium]